jgi:hypothetical protein
LNCGDKLTGEVAERFFADSVKALEKQKRQQEIAKLNEQYKAEADEETKRQIAARIQELMRANARK